MNPIWITMNGEGIPLSSMTITHIKNCLSCIQEKKFNHHWLRLNGEKWEVLFKEELSKRGEIL